ncbi:MAG TPA: hypothetical protein VIO58_10740 [Candidatus Methanoperedens sp.]
MNIKIIICFIIIIFIPFASASMTNTVWIARSSGFITSNDSLTFENFLIKAKPIDTMNASVEVYKNQNKIDQKDFHVNDFQEYGNVRITLLGIWGNYSWIAISKPETKEILVPSGNKLLKWGEKYEIENHTISAETFGQETVTLTITGKDLAETEVFSKNDFRDYGNLRIAVREINESGFVELEFLKYPVPDISAGISTDKDEYAPDETILVTVNKTNDAAWNVAGIFFESSPGGEIKPSFLSLTNVTGKNSFRTRVLQLPADSAMTLTASIELLDYNFNKYTTKVSRVVRSLPLISITKHVPPETDERNVTVDLYIHNAGTTEESVSVYDTVYENETLDPKQLNWAVRLKPGSSATLSYYAVPQKSGRYVFPPATAKWKNYSSVSSEVEMIVHGPLIVMNKSTARKNDVTEVRLSIYNAGDRPALVNVADKIPDGYPIASGNATWSGLLEGGESTTVVYALQGNIGTLPDAWATYRDIHGVYRHAHSNAVEISEVKKNIENQNNNMKENDINANEKNNAASINVRPDEMLSFMIVSFMVIAGIITGAAMSAYLLIRFKR